MEPSGHQERKDVSLRLRVVVQVFFYAILLDILCTLFSFLFRIANVVLAGMLRISHRLMNLYKYVKTEEIVPEDLPIVEDDFKNDSANLRDDHHVTDTNSPEINDTTNSSEIKGAGDIPELDPVGLETEEIGLKNYPKIGVDLRDAHDVTETNPSESNDDTTDSSSFEINLSFEINQSGDIPEVDPEGLETKEIGLENYTVVGKDLKDDSANLRDAHNVTETNPSESNDDTTSSSSSENNRSGDIPEEDPEGLETEEIGLEKKYPVVGEDLKDDSANLRDAHNVTETNPSEINDDTTNSSSSEISRSGDIPEDDPEGLETEVIGLEKNYPVVGVDLKDDSANLRDAHNVTETNPSESNDDTTDSSEINRSDIPGDDPEGLETEEIGLENYPVVEEDLKDDSAILRDAHNVTDTNPPYRHDDTSSCASSLKINEAAVSAESTEPEDNLTSMKGSNDTT